MNCDARSASWSTEAGAMPRTSVNSVPVATVTVVKTDGSMTATESSVESVKYMSTMIRT